MSSLWTPDGEHRVSASSTPPPAQAAADFDRAFDGESDDEFPVEDMAAIERELAESRARLAEVPAEVVVINHAMGLYELAAIHLSATPARLRDAALAIDAFGCLVEGLGDRLGPDVATLNQALSQIRLAFVQIKGSMGEPA